MSIEEASRLIAIADKLAWEMTSWRSLKLDVAQSFLSTPDAMSSSKENVFLYHYVETAAGQRLLDTRCVSGDKVTIHYQYYFDGKRGSTVTFDLESGDPEKQASVSFGAKSFGHESKSDYTDRPIPLKFFYVGKIPMHEAARRARVVGEELWLDRACLVAQLADRLPSAPDLVYQVHFDQITGVPLRVSLLRGADPVSTWEAQSLDTIAGYHFPLRSTFTSSARGSDPALLLRTGYQINSIEFNKTHPRSSFTPTPQPGVKVFGGRPLGQNTPSKIGQPVPGSVEHSTTATSQPMRVGQEQSSWGPSLSTWSFWVGICVVAVGVVLKLRRS